MDGEKLSASDSEYEDELSSLIRQYDIGKTVELTVLRDQGELKVPVELARSPRLQREMKKYRSDDFEFTARDVSFFDTVEEQWDSAQRGALVENVKGGSWAELGSLSDGDLIRGSERPAGGLGGRAPARAGTRRRRQRENRGDQGAPRHSHLLPGDRAELEELTSYSKLSMRCHPIVSLWLWPSRWPAVRPPPVARG